MTAQGFPAPDRRASDYRLAAATILLAAAGTRLAFWLTTQWTIEDAFIIARMVRNLVDHGSFTFNLGQRVSASTSPLFAVMTAAISVFGVAPPTAAKVLGVAASTFTCVLVFDLLASIVPPTAALAGSLVYALLPPSVAYSVAGMETPVYAAACALTLERTVRRRNEQALLAGSIAALLRPDGAIVLGVAGAVSFWRLKREPARLVRAILPGAAVLAAGVGLHWLYFGQLLPQSLVAKGIGYQIDPVDNTIKYLQRMFLNHPEGVAIYVLGAAGGWIACRRWPALSILAVWYIVFHLFFFVRAPWFDWYLQPPLFVLCLFAGFGLIQVVEFASVRYSAMSQSAAFAAASTGVSLVLGAALVLYARGRIDAQRYSDEVNTSIGRWLALHSDPADLVFTESLGYIGYNTTNPFVDWPGLASPGVPPILASTNSTNSRRRGYDAVIAEYRPPYLALRDEEWDRLAAPLKREYHECAHFAPPSHGDVAWVVAGRVCPERASQ